MYVLLNDIKWYCFTRNVDYGFEKSNKELIITCSKGNIKLKEHIDDFYVKKGNIFIRARHANEIYKWLKAVI